MSKGSVRDYSYPEPAREAEYQAEHSYSNAPGFPYEPTKLFDITCVIGSVYSGASDLTPREAAFLMIARLENKAGATFTFPNEDGTLNHITVETSEPAQP